MAIESIEQAHRRFNVGTRQFIVEHKRQFYRVTLLYSEMEACGMELLYTRKNRWGSDRACTRAVYRRSPRWSILEKLAIAAATKEEG